MSELLVAVDGSKHSEKVVDSACQLAKDLTAPIVLLYVMRRMPEEPEGIKAFEESEHYDEAYAKYLADVGEEVTSKLTERIKAQNVSYDVSTEFGNPVDIILETAKLRKPRMIVLGLHGHRYVSRIRSLGSVARTVIENATCPVLVVS
jgi:nucleotide-binding universal stress UspA family protein